ncbi:MAG: hypothetical protein RL625_1625 [Gemmatimonadota bacterium]
MIRVSRLGLVHGAFLLFAGALLARAAWIQLGQRDRWSEVARAQQTVEKEVPQRRGSILDRAGTVLVESRSLVRLDIAPTEVRDRAVLRTALQRIRVPETFVARATDPARKWVELPGRFLSTEVEDLLAMRGVHPRPVLERVPPPTQGLRNLLGTTDRDGKAVGGVEASLNAVLEGETGRTVLVRNGRVGALASPEERSVPPVDGQTVLLTIHQPLQDIAERVLTDAIAERNARGGDVLLLDPHTGEIRALASRRARADASGATALTEPYEPGSTVKPFIAAALIERARVQLDEVIPTYNGVIEWHGRTIKDVHEAASMTVAEVISQSSNVGIVQLAERLTLREEYEALRDVGFGMVTGLPYPSESPGRLRAVSEWSKQSPASLAMGYELSVTPLQLAMAYAAFANGGELLEPTLVREVRHPDGSVRFQSQRRVVRRVMSPSTAATMRKLLRDVVTTGTGMRADLAGYGVAGKSGTARRMRDDGRGYEEGAYTASFVGFFPAEDPQLVILVKLDAPSGAFYGGEIAAPVTKAVLQAALAARDGALELKGAPVPPPATAIATALPTIANAAVPVSAITAEESAGDTSDAPVVYDLAVPVSAPRRVVISRPVPEVRGLSTRAAVRALHRAGFRVTIDASAATGETSPAAGTVLPSGSVVRFAPLRGGER